MAKSWSEVEQSDAYQSLNPEDRISAKQEYWNNVVIEKKSFSSLSTEDKQLAQNEFLGGIRPEKKVGFFGGVPESAYQSGERNIMGNIFERPAAAIRSALMGKGYIQGAVNPTNVPSFQNLALDKYYQTVGTGIPQQIGGLGISALGMGADILTNPADLIPMVAGMSPTIQRAGKAIGATEPAQAFSRFLNKERQVANFTKHFPKVMTDNWLVTKARQVKQVVDETIGGLRTEYQKIFSPHKDLTVSLDKLNAIPKQLLDDMGITGDTTVGQLWEVRDNLLQQITEGSWNKEDLYKRLRLKEEDLMGAMQKIKATILNAVPKDTREAILKIDPKYSETMKLGKKLIRTVYEPTSDTYKTGSLVNVYKNPTNAGAREAFKRFQQYNSQIGQIGKDIAKFVFRQQVKRLGERVVGGGLVLGTAYGLGRKMANKLSGQE